MGWMLLKTSEDWNTYQQGLLRDYGITPNMPVKWGGGPQQYPCLVATTRAIDGKDIKMVSAYVYRHNAETLLQASVPVAATAAVPASATPPVFHPNAKLPPAQGTVGSTTRPVVDQCSASHSTGKQPAISQDDFNRGVTAYLLALVRELLEVGALKAEPFEGSLMEATSMIDEVVTIQRDAMVKPEQDLLRRLWPTE